MIVEELVGLLGWKVEGEQNLKRFQEGMRKTTELVQRLATVAAAAGAVVGAAMAALGKGVIETSAQFEGFETSLETIEGSAEKARKAMDWVVDFAAKTPYEIADTTEAFIKLKSYGLDPVNGLLETLGDTASGMNKPLDAAVEAFADAATFQFERLRSFGITTEQAGDKVTFKWTKNGKDMTRTVKKTGEEVRKFLLKNFGERFGGAMDRQSRTWNGLLSNIRGAWEKFQLAIGRAGFFDAMKKRLQGLYDYIEKLDKDGTLKRWAKSISDVMTAGADIIGNVFERIKKAITQVSDFLSENSDVFGPLKWAFLALMAFAFPTAAAVAAVAIAVEDFLTYLRGGDSVFGDFVDSMNKLMPSLKDIPEQIKKLDFHGVGKSLGKAIVEGLSGIGAAIGEKIGEVDWKHVFELWAGAIKAEIEFFTGIFDGIGAAIGQALLDGMTPIANDIKAWFQSLLPDWAAEFFDFREGQKKGLIDKATAESERRQRFERAAPTKPASQNTPVLKDTLDQVRNAQYTTDQKARFARWGNAAENARMNSLRATGGAISVPSVTNHNSFQPQTTVNLTVEQITQAASAAAASVKDAVSSKLSSISNTPSRKVMSPWSR